MRKFIEKYVDYLVEVFANVIIQDLNKYHVEQLILFLIM